MDGALGRPSAPTWRCRRFLGLRELAKGQLDRGEFLSACRGSTSVAEGQAWWRRCCSALVTPEAGALSRRFLRRTPRAALTVLGDPVGLQAPVIDHALGVHVGCGALRHKRGGGTGGGGAGQRRRRRKRTGPCRSLQPGPSTATRLGGSGAPEAGRGARVLAVRGGHAGGEEGRVVSVDGAVGAHAGRRLDVLRGSGGGGWPTRRRG